MKRDTHLPASHPAPPSSPRLTFGRAWRAETRRLRHSFLIPLHVTCSLVAGLACGAYFAFAAWDPTLGADAFVQVLGAMMPLMVGIICGLDADSEAEATGFFNLVALPSRGRIFAAKVVVLWALGCVALALATGVFVLVLQVGGKQSLGVGTWIGAVLGLGCGSAPIYLLLYVVALKWGRNPVIALGAVGLMLAFFSMGGLAHGLVTGKLTASQLNVFSFLPTSWPAVLGALPIELAVASSAGNMRDAVEATLLQVAGLDALTLVVLAGLAGWWIRRFEPNQRRL